MRPWHQPPESVGTHHQQQLLAAAATTHQTDRGRSSGVGGHGMPAFSPPTASSTQPTLSRWTCFTHDASGGERRRGTEDESCPVRALCFDGGGLLATADGGAVRLWSLERRRRICTLKTTSGRDELHAGGVSCIAIDGQHLLSGGGDGALHLIDLEILCPAATLRGHGMCRHLNRTRPAMAHPPRVVLYRG